MYKLYYFSKELLSKSPTYPAYLPSKQFVKSYNYH